MTLPTRSRRDGERRKPEGPEAVAAHYSFDALSTSQSNTVVS